MKVVKVADIVDGEIMFSGQGKTRAVELVKILTNIERAKDPNVDFTWKAEIEIGTGPAARSIMLDLSQCISVSDSLDTPLFIGNGKLAFFRGQLFMPERAPKNALEAKK